MLKLILGRQKSGKTKYCLDILKSAAEKGEKAVLLVPEQFSFECQRYLLDSFGAVLSNKIEILSFTGLCEEIQSSIGGFAGINVDDGTRFILVGQALNSVKDNLKLYTKYYNSSAFIKQIMSVIIEFKQAGITPDELIKMSVITENESSKHKLEDLSIILSAYNALLTKRFQDPLDLIERTVSGMQDNSYFNGKTVVIDEFKGFTAVQFKLLERIIAGSKNTVITLCCDSITPLHETDIFGNIKKTANRLIRIANQHGVSVPEPTILDNYNKCSADIELLELVLADKQCDKFKGKSENVAVVKAESIFSEIDFCMTTIRRLVRESGYRYKDFCIISRNDSYKDIIDEYSRLYEIPVFTDNRVPMLSLPISAFVLSAVKAALSFNTEDILNMLKTGLAGLSKEETAKLENYAYVWSIDGKRWLDKWTMSQNGFNSVDITEEKLNTIQKETEKLDKLRQNIIMPLINLKKAFNGTAEDICVAVLRLFEDYSTVDYLNQLVDKLENNGNFADAEYLALGYDILIKVFDKIVLTFESRELSGQEFFEVLTSVLGFETVGEIPQTKDQIVYGTADRIRPLRPKCVFVIGINQDVFPSAVNDEGILTVAERQSMILNDLAVADRGITDCLDEKFLFYLASTYASEKVFLTFAETNAQGSALEPAIELEAVLKHFPENCTVNYSGNLRSDLIETKESAFIKLTENYFDDSIIADSLKEYFSNDSEYFSRIEAVKRYVSADAPRLSSDKAELLYGDGLTLSASKINDFAGCKFLYFVKYGLGIKRLEKVDFDPLTRGNIIHYCLEKFVKNHLGDIGYISNAVIFDEITVLCDEYIFASVNDINALDEKFKYMLEIIKDTACHLAVCLNNEFNQSDFRPKFCELNVGDGEALDGIHMLTDSGHKVTLKGYIDRVDTTEDGKVRVVDYKTGSKGDSFKLSELLNGRDIQMLLYLYSVIKNGQDLIKAEIPAGVLYFPAKRQIEDINSQFVKMTGLVIDDEQTLMQMEKALEGKIIPPHKRQGGSYYSTEAMVSREAFDAIFNYLEVILQRIGSLILSGDTEALPLKVGDSDQCKFCDYRAICRVSPEIKAKEGVKCKNSEALEIIRKELKEENGN